jgi:hypothetical protein
MWINLSKGTPSLSVGGHGLTANISTRGLTTTVGAPGTGLSYRHTMPWGDRRPSRHEVERLAIQLGEEEEALIREQERNGVSVSLCERRYVNASKMEHLCEILGKPAPKCRQIKEACEQEWKALMGWR